MLLFYLNMVDDENERSLFESLYIKYRHLMYTIANNILQDSYLAEDAVHQAFLNIIPHLTKFQLDDVENSKTMGYMIVVTRNAALRLQSSRHNYVSFDELDDIQILGATEDFETHLEYKELLEKIHKLPNRYRDVLLLKYVYGCDYNEIKNILNIKNVTTLRKQVQRAKEMLGDKNGR